MDHLSARMPSEVRHAEGTPKKGARAEGTSAESLKRHFPKIQIQAVATQKMRLSCIGMRGERGGFDRQSTHRSTGWVLEDDLLAIVPRKRKG